MLGSVLRDFHPAPVWNVAFYSGNEIP